MKVPITWLVLVCGSIMLEGCASSVPLRRPWAAPDMVRFLDVAKVTGVGVVLKMRRRGSDLPEDREVCSAIYDLHAEAKEIVECLRTASRSRYLGLGPGVIGGGRIPLGAIRVETESLTLEVVLCPDGFWVGTVDDFMTKFTNEDLKAIIIRLAKDYFAQDEGDEFSLFRYNPSPRWYWRNDVFPYSRPGSPEEGPREEEPDTQPVVGKADGAMTDAVDVPGDKAITLDLGDKVTMRLAWIPSGKFTMGSPDNEYAHMDAEGPRREVAISKPFYMGVHEVTQEQYQAVMGSNPSKSKEAQGPVEMVSWDDAMAFCQALSHKTGRAVRLPTEAEWEYACRAGTTTPFHTGQTISTDQVNFEGEYTPASPRRGKYRGKPVSVGSFKPNAWGLCDMHGNVWEWCADWYADSYADANAVDPPGPASGTARVVRGGSWRCSAEACRSAFRLWHPPGRRDCEYGFRVVVDLE